MSDDLSEEKQQAFRTLEALLQRRDAIHEETGEDPLENVGEIIKTAGMIRDQIPVEDTPYASEIDPEEVFDDE